MTDAVETQAATPAVSIDDARWISVKPSIINLVLTFTVGVIVVVALSFAPMPEWAWWVKIFALTAAPILLILEAWQIFQKGQDAVVAFWVEPLSSATNDAADPLLSPNAENADATQRTGNATRLRLHLRTRAGRTREASILPRSFVSFYFVSIMYAHEDDAAWRRKLPRTLAIWPDSIPPEDARKLRVTLKWR
jgi:hypothetical protein